MVNAVAGIIVRGIVDFAYAFTAAALDKGTSVPFVGYSVIFVHSIFVLVADV
jgi:hypothetical protein